MSQILIFSDLVKENKEEFLAEVKAVSQRLKINSNWLMAVMYKESRLNHRAVNPTGGATGLIQFMPSTATGLGTSTSKLKALSNVEQLYYVEKYFKPFTGRINSFFDLYLITFFPAAIPKPPAWYFQTSRLSADLIGRQNPGINGGAPINKISFNAYLLKSIDKALHSYLS